MLKTLYTRTLFLGLLLLGSVVAAQNQTVVPLLIQPLPLQQMSTQQLDQELMRLSVTRQALESRLQTVQAQHRRLQENESALNEHILALSGSVQIYRVLQQQRAALPTVSLDPDLSDLIADTRLRQFEISQLQQSGYDAVHLPLEELLDELQALVSLAVTLQSEQRALASTSERLGSSLAEQLFWIPSNLPFGLQWLAQFPSQLGNQVSQLPKSFQLGFDIAHLNLWQSLFALILLGTGIALWWSKNWLAQQLEQSNQEMEAYSNALHATHFRSWEDTEIALDDPLPPEPPKALLTAQAIGWVALQALPLSLVILSFSMLLTPQEKQDVMTVGPALLALSFSLFVVFFLRRILSTSKIADLHFHWPREQRQILARFLSRFAWVLLPTSFILALAEQQTVSLADDVLGVCVMVASGTAIAWLFSRLLRQVPKVYGSQGLHWLLTAVMVLLPLGLVMLTLAGYYYSALQLTGRLLATFYVLAAWVVVEVTVMQGINHSTARLKRQRDREAREAKQLQQASPDGQTFLLEPEVRAEILKVRQQTLRLARFLLLAAFGGLLYWVWADLFTALGYLDSIILWEYGGPETPTPMSLADFLTALFIIGITLFLAANLPGLLEMLVLSRLSLQQGSAYAITTLMNYIITSIGIIVALSSLGVSWDKLQWLVAALSVGLGFGLQEIFANFVSGLIILFERPVRIGDVVTLGNLSGRVRQIRIRATTITDFDRKDIIVPNKTFVTEQLINWSLTDTVTRVIVHIGVAYGSDLELTRKILLKAARSNPRVLSDPEPQVLFLSFGASTLDHELRIHVKELSDRNPAIDEINRYIDREFSAAGIEIAFRQIDIRLRNSEGVERLIEQRLTPPDNP